MSLNDKMQSSSYSNGRLPSLTAVHSTRRHISENRKIERSYFQVNKTSLQLYYIKSETQTLLHVTQFIRTSLSMTQDKIHGLSPDRVKFLIIGSDLWQPCL